MEIPEDEDVDSDEVYLRAHEKLVEILPDLEGGSFFENTPQDSAIGLMDSPEWEE